MKRSHTDCICCVVFLMFCIGMIGTAVYGFLNGDPNLLLTTWDYDKNGCGYNISTKSYPYLYFVGPFPSFNSSALSNAYNGNPYEAFKYSVCV